MRLAHLIFFVWCFGIYSTIAQNVSFKNTPIKEVLTTLEQKHNIKFSYAEEDLGNTTISFDFSEINLSQTLKKLNELSGLTYTKLTERYITIVNEVNVEAYIKAPTTNAPLMGCSIIVLNKNKGSISDETGYFTLKNIGINDTLSISYLGYKTTFIPTKSLLNNPNYIITLEEGSNLLEEVIINNYLTNGMTKNNDGSEVFTSSKLGILPGLTEPDILQSIQLLPGVQSPNETASGLHIRGGTPDQNLILFEGIKMYNAAHFFGMVSAFNPYATRKAKVFRNGASASYGNHISGVIDITSDPISPQKFNGQLGTNLIHADFVLKTPIGERVGLLIAGRRSFADLYNSPTFKQISQKVFQNSIVSENNAPDEEIESEDRFNTFVYADFNAKLFIDISRKDKATISFIQNQNQLDYSLDEEEETDALSHSLRYYNYGSSLNWNRNWNSKLTQNTKLYYSHFDLKSNFKRKGDNIITDEISKKNKVKELQLQSVIEWNFSQRSNLNFGYELTNSDVGASINANFDDDADDTQLLIKGKNNAHALFGEYRYVNTDQTTINIGLRANHFSFSKTVFLSPRLYVQHQLFPNFWVKSSAEYKQQNISKILEFFTDEFGVDNQIWVLAEKNEIPVLKSLQFASGFLYKKNNWSLDIDLYSKNINGLTSLRKGFTNQQDNHEQGNSTTLGIDIFVKKEWTNFNTSIGYSLSNSQLKFQGINNGEKFAGNFDARHQFLWTNSLKIKQFDFSLGWTYRTGIPYTFATGLTADDKINFQAINGKRLPDYHRLDFSATYKFSFTTDNNWNGKIGVSLLNMYNQKNILQRNYRTRENQDEGIDFVRIDTYSLGLTPNLVFRVIF